MDLKKLYIEYAVYPAMTLLQHNHVMAHTGALKGSERLSETQRASHCRQRISEILFLCRDRVPAYDDLPFSDLDLRQEPMDCLLAVDPIPLGDFLADASRYLRRDADLHHLLHSRFGVDGQPEADLYLSRTQLEQYEAARWRGLSWYGVTCGSRSLRLWDRPRDPFVLEEEPYMKNRISLSVCAMTTRSVRPTVNEIDRFRPEYLSGSASGFATLAAFMEKTNIRLKHQPKVITITQGVADETTLAQLKAVFRCPVAQNLGVRSEGLLAYMCPEGQLHVTAENCYVELLDPQSWMPVGPGQTGLVTVTDLLDETMPHLRVVLDYSARWAAEPCSCGRTLPVLENLKRLHPAEY